MLLKVNAKINLSLDITGKQENGYHTLDMVMTSINLSDYITLTKRQDKCLNVRYKDGRVYTNDIAKKAGNMLIEKYDIFGADIVIEKHIPEKSGLGGSSSDASGVIFGLAKLNNLPLENIDIKDVLAIGSDCPYMLYGGTRRVLGLGEQISSKIDLEPMHFVLLTDDVGVDTAKAYKTYCYGYNRFNNTLLIEKILKGECELQGLFTNSLYDSSRLLNPAIDDKINLLKRAGCVDAFMTGSGSGVVGYYKLEPTKDEKAILQSIVNGKYGIYYINNVNTGIEILG